MSDCQWSKRCLGLDAARAMVNLSRTPAGKLSAVEMMLKYGTICRRHARPILDMPAEDAQTELKGV